MDKQKLYQEVLAVYGAEAQTRMYFEESAELQKELCKHARGRGSRHAIAEEIADVRIMLEQMERLHDCAELVEQFIAYKLDRLARTLEEQPPC